MVRAERRSTARRRAVGNRGATMGYGAVGVGRGKHRRRRRVRAVRPRGHVSWTTHFAQDRARRRGGGDRGGWARSGNLHFVPVGPETMELIPPLAESALRQSE